jgi:hypothetical protein
MSSEQPRVGARERGGSGGSPIGSTAAIVIAVVSVIGGFLILRQIRDDRGSSGAGVPATTPSRSTTPSSAGTTVPSSGIPTTSVAETTTVPAITKGARVIVANASITNGAAGVVTTALKAKGFDMEKATNAGGAESKLDKTKVYYDSSNAAALPVANYLAFLVGGAPVAKLPTTIPTKDGTLPAGVTVLLMLGNDKAAKTLDEMSGATGTATSVGGATTTVKATGKTTTTVKGKATTTTKKP